MPKSSDKKKGAQTKRKTSRISSENTALNGDEGNIAPKKRKLLKKPDYKNEIAKSKQLASRLRNPTSRSSSSSKKTEPRLCGNGMPMPSLADLERMFEDSDSDEEPTSTAKVKISERPKTPENPIPAIEKKLVSPKTIKNIASKLMDMISNNEILPIVNDGPPPPIVPQKKPKKSDIPYIVGCKERRQVPWQPKTSFGQGDEDYGVDKNAAGSDDEENSCPKKRRRGTKVNLSKSIFNAQSDEIAERLKNNEERLEGQLNSSPESTNTEPYEYSENSNYMTKHFEPLASTSTDRVTIDINDRLFNESLNSALSNNSQDHLEVIEINNTKCSKDNKDVSIQNNQQYSADDDSCIIIGNEIKNESRNNNESSVDCCVIIDSDSEGKNENRCIETIIEDDLPNYDISTIDLTDNNDIDMGEVIDIDSIIAENEATISKYRVKNTLDSVTLVKPSNSRNSEEDTASDRNTNPSNTLETNLEQNKTIPESIPVTLQDTGSNADRIANVVADFFAQSDNERNNQDNVIDLTEHSSGTLVNKITSWISKIQSFMNGRHTSQDEGNNFLRFVNQTPSNSGESNDQSHLQSGRIRICQVRDNQSLYTKITTVPSIAKRNYQQPNSVPSVLHENIVPSAGPTADNTGANRSSPQQMPSHPRLGDCPICMDSLLNNPIASTICGHVFCMKCIKAAVKANGKKCPNCRMKFKGVGYHQLFL